MGAAGVFPSAPPTFPRLLVLGSGANIIPVARSLAFNSSRMMPGCVRTHPSSALTSKTSLMYLEKSMTTACPTVWPAKLVPPPRGRTGTPCRFAASTTAMTSRSDRGMTTPTGSIWYMLASVL